MITILTPEQVRKTVDFSQIKNLALNQNNSKEIIIGQERAIKG